MSVSRVADDSCDDLGEQVQAADGAHGRLQRTGDGQHSPAREGRDHENPRVPGSNRSNERREGVVMGQNSVVHGARRGSGARNSGDRMKKIV